MNRLVLLSRFSLHRSHPNRPPTRFSSSIIRCRRCYSTESNESDASRDDDVSLEELKSRIQKFYEEGDTEVIPSILEGILKRKLAGKSDESLLEQLPPGHGREEFDSGEDSD